MVASLRVTTIIKEYRKLDIRIKYIEHLMKNNTKSFSLFVVTQFKF
jgi:hypothetical protein